MSKPACKPCAVGAVAVAGLLAWWFFGSEASAAEVTPSSSPSPTPGKSPSTTPPKPTTSAPRPVEPLSTARNFLIASGYVSAGIVNSMIPNVKPNSTGWTVYLKGDRPGEGFIVAVAGATGKATFIGRV